jgi:hypothetical protein
MSITTYNAHELVGANGDRVLSVLDPANLHDGDQAICNLFDPATQKYECLFFVFDAEATDETEIEEHPYRVRPNNYSGSGVWWESEASISTKILFGPGDPPSAAGLPDGCLYLKYE